MGKILAKLCSYSCCCCCCCCHKSQQNRVLPMQTTYKVLLLGLSGSGKTDLGYMLSGKTKRLDFAPTNGVQYFQHLIAPSPQTDSDTGKLSITEIGGNEEMQKLWPHYYATTMAVIYCVDMSVDEDSFRKSFETFTLLAGHRFVRGKPILLVATKLALMDASSRGGMQLYDIENAFQLDRLARQTACSLRLCCYDGLAMEAGAELPSSSICDGIKWLTTHLMDHRNALQLRVKCDENIQLWESTSDKLLPEINLRKYYKYPRRPKNFGPRKLWSRASLLRPRTAPSVIFHISSSLQSNNNDLMAPVHRPPSTNLVPKSNGINAYPLQNGHAVAI